jgi:N-acetylglucosamine malate deacetylase 1
MRRPVTEPVRRAVTRPVTRPVTRAVRTAVTRPVRRAVTRAVARAKPLVPARAWPTLLALRSYAGDGPVVGEPRLRSVAVLGAHPDDESLGCAGTIALLRHRGASVVAAFATDGEATRGATTDAGETARRRRGEARAACRVLGVDDVAFWGLPDGGLDRCTSELASHIALLAAGRDGLLMPWFLDGHPDHEALSAALAVAGLPAGLEVWGYETWAPLPANRIVDITGVLEQKEAAIAAHATANQAFELGAAMGLNRWRSIHGLMGRGYAEAFLAAPVKDYLALRSQVMR